MEGGGSEGQHGTMGAAAAVSAAQQNIALSAAAVKVVDAAKRKFATHMDQELLDYKHNHPTVIEGAAQMLIKIFTNVIEHPGEEKYRSVKATANAFKAVTNARGGEHLMTLAGFGTKVVNLQKHWVFESDTHGVKDRILAECEGVLQRALGTISEKAERKRHEGEDKNKLENDRREQLRMALEDDRADRKLKEEQMRAAAESTAAVAEAERLAAEAERLAAEAAFAQAVADKAAETAGKVASEAVDKAAEQQPPAPAGPPAGSN